MSESDKITVRALSALLFMLVVVVVIAGLNLYLPFSSAYLTSELHIRWREMISLLFVTPVAIILCFFIFFTLECNRQNFFMPLLLLLLGCSWLAISMGVHEPINAFRSQISGTIGLYGRVLWFWDEIFSHTIFFAGYAAVSFALLWSQARNPLLNEMSKKQQITFLGYGIIAGLGITWSLLPGASYKVDSWVIVGVLIIARLIRGKNTLKKCPINMTMETAYLLALILLLINLFI